MGQQATQTRHPWRATVRTVFQALVALAATWAVIVEAAGFDDTTAWVAASLAVTGAVTRVMALPQVDAWLARFVPWLASGAEQDAAAEHLHRHVEAVDDSGHDPDAPVGQWPPNAEGDAGDDGYPRL